MYKQHLFCSAFLLLLNSLFLISTPSPGWCLERSWIFTSLFNLYSDPAFTCCACCVGQGPHMPRMNVQKFTLMLSHGLKVRSFFSFSFSLPAFDGIGRFLEASR